MNKLTKLFALLLVVALASTTFYVGTQLNSTVYPLGDEQNVTPIDLESPLEFDPLHVSLNGESKLHVNESSVYEAVVSGGSGNFSYAWGIEPVDEKVVFEYSGSTCSFMFVVATIDPYTLSVEVTDLVSGDKAFDSFTVYDPYTLPDLYLESSLADFVCRVKSDGTGWYFVSDGESGKTLFSSTVLLDATNYALTSTTSGNVLLDGVYFDYSLDIPVGVSVTESVDGLVRVFVNEADRQGSPYTVSVDSVHPTYYLVQDGMGRFINDFSSSNQTALQDTVLGATTSGEIRLNEVAFDLALMNSIPENVKVACSYQDQYVEYINSADSSGSPYTVEVGAGVNVGYYTAKDSENRICFTSTNASYVLTESINKGRVFISEGKYYINNTIILTSPYIYVEGSGNGNSAGGTNTELILGDNANCDMFQFKQSPSAFAVLPYFAHFKCTGNMYNQDGGEYMAFNQINHAVVDPFFEDIWFNLWSGYAIHIISGWDIRIDKCQFENSRTYGICLDASTADLDNVVITNCYFATGGTTAGQGGGVLGKYRGGTKWPTGVTIANCVFRGTVEAGNMGNPWIVPRGQNWLITNNQAISSGTFVALVGGTTYYTGINIDSNNIQLLQGYAFYNNITHYEASNVLIQNNIISAKPHATYAPTSGIVLGRTNSSLIANNMFGTIQCNTFSSYAISLVGLGYNNTIVNNIIKSDRFPNGTISSTHSGSIGITIENNYIQ